MNGIKCMCVFLVLLLTFHLFISVLLSFWFIPMGLLTFCHMSMSWSGYLFLKGDIHDLHYKSKSLLQYLHNRASCPLFQNTVESLLPTACACISTCVSRHNIFPTIEFTIFSYFPLSALCFLELRQVVCYFSTASGKAWDCLIAMLQWYLDHTEKMWWSGLNPSLSCKHLNLVCVLEKPETADKGTQNPQREMGAVGVIATTSGVV